LPARENLLNRYANMVFSILKIYYEWYA
jgi:hypothetical protein